MDDDIELDEELNIGGEDRGDNVDPNLPDDDDELDVGSDGKGEGEGAPDDAKPDADEELDADDLAELAGEGKSKSVPHSRFNEVNEQLKTERAERLRLEEELARARGAGKPQDKPADPPADAPAAFDFDAAEERFAAALYEGDQAAAKQIRAEIRQAERAEFERMAEDRAEKRLQERMQQQEQESLKTRVETAAIDAVTKYPFLNSDADEANAEAIEEVVALRDYYVNRGTPLDQAIAKAADKVGKRYATEQPAGDGKPDPVKPSAEQLARNLERSNRIPPRGVGAGERSQKMDYEALTEEQFDALPDAEKRKARGDFVG